MHEITKKSIDLLSIFRPIHASTASTDHIKYLKLNLFLSHSMYRYYFHVKKTQQQRALSFVFDFFFFVSVNARYVNNAGDINNTIQFIFDSTLIC